VTHETEILLEARDIVQEFAVQSLGGRVLRAVAGVSLSIARGETLGIVGESGSGKTTFARALLQLPRPRSGSVLFRGQDLTRLRGRKLLESRRAIQMVFQDPCGSLDPRWSVAQIIEEPLIGYRMGTRAQRRSKVSELLDHVGLSWSTHARCRPGELSGGQCQRVAIARALAPEPALLICDEAVSALDVSIQAQLLNLFELLREQHRLSYLFISHDLAVVKRVSDRVAVLYLGQLCEIGPVGSLYGSPRHPYTAKLLAAARKTLPTQERFVGDARPFQMSTGCRFRTSCRRSQERCAVENPELRPVGPGHWVACHFPEEIAGTDLELTPGQHAHKRDLAEVPVLAQR
jgi:oligopeptide transport system ATP-binding protein